jgi:hypothetical protein
MVDIKVKKCWGVFYCFYLLATYSKFLMNIMHLSSLPIFPDVFHVKSHVNKKKSSEIIFWSFEDLL